MKAIITGGGTGGHIYPALAVGLKLKEMDWQVLYIGSKEGLEKSISKEWNIEFDGIKVAPLPRKVTPKIVSSVLYNFKGLYQASKKIRKFDPDIVFGTGGFVAGPIVLAAILHKIPTLIHEQNVYPGITNKILSYFVNNIAVNFADSKKYFSDRVNKKVIITGNPVREIILKTKYREGIKYFGLENNKKNILVFGGSQGAESINNAMTDLYKLIQEKRNLQLIHITGKKNYKNQLKFAKRNGINIVENADIKIVPYLEHIEYAYAISDLGVSRAGATGIAEITAKGIPAILIPYPHATGNHQLYNAKSLVNQGAAEIIIEDELNSETLKEKVLKIITNDDLLKNMANKSKNLGNHNSTEKIINQIDNIIKR